MSRMFLQVAAVVAVSSVILLANPRGPKVVRTRLSGFQEVPALSSPATGEFRGQFNANDTELKYDLEYQDLVGSVTQAHIHLGQRATNGGIMIWLCGTPTNPGPAGTPLCPASGKVSGTITASNVIGPSGQGISAGAFAAAVDAIRSGFAYVNVHSTQYPPGEIRGQIQDDK